MDRIKRTYLCLFVLGFLANSAVAQEKALDVVVEYIAGPNLYLNVGNQEGISAGDTLRVFRGDSPIGQWRVISSSSSRTVVTFVTETIAVTRGQAFRIWFTPGITQAIDSTSEDAPAQPARASLLGATSASPPPSRQKNRSPVRLTGRLSLDLNTLQSTTRVSGEPQIERSRTFTTPTVGLRAKMTHLPGDVALNVNLRVSHRYSTNTIIDPPSSFRFYRASLEKSFQNFPMYLQVGRFYNRYERFSGYWDGLMLHFGSPSFGGGIIGGFQPERADEGFFKELPKASVFLNYAFKKSRTRYTFDLSISHIQPSNTYQQHTYWGWYQQFKWQQMTLSQDLQVDRNPNTDRWVVTRFQVRAALPLARRIRLLGRYILRQPYILSRPTNPISYRRDQGNLGLTYQLHGGALGLSTTANRIDQGETSLTYSGYFSVTESSLWRLGFNGNISFWSRENTNAFYVTAGLQRIFSGIRTQLRYTRYSSTGPRTLTSHMLHLSLNIPLTARLFSTVQVRSQWGETLLSNAFYISLWMRL